VNTFCFQGEQISSDGQYIRLDAPYDFIPIHVRAGYIVPTQEPAANTVLSRQNAFGLIVALDGSRSSKGDLFWDDGESIDTVGSGNYHYSTFDFTQVRQNTFASTQNIAISYLFLGHSHSHRRSPLP
jgi:alpha-glucosidase (family GH31 glycosyl hydrolase)